MLLRLACLIPLVFVGPPAALVPVVNPTQRFTKRQVYVMDVSGSMSGKPFDKALTALAAVAAQPTDDMEISVIAFESQVARWPRGWVQLPDAEAVDAATAWLSEQGSGGNTFVVPALEAALKEKRTELTVVLVTDGIFNEDDSVVLEAVRKAQEQRVEYGRAIVAVLGVGKAKPVLRMLAEEGKGGYFREE